MLLEHGYICSHGVHRARIHSSRLIHRPDVVDVGTVRGSLREKLFLACDICSTEMVKYRVLDSVGRSNLQEQNLRLVRTTGVKHILTST